MSELEATRVHARHPQIMSTVEARDALKAAHEALPIELSINSFLIEIGARPILTPLLASAIRHRSNTWAA